MFSSEGLYLILFNVRVCSDNDSLLHTGLGGTTFHYLLAGISVIVIIQQMDMIISSVIFFRVSPLILQPQ